MVQEEYYLIKKQEVRGEIAGYQAKIIEIGE